MKFVPLLLTIVVGAIISSSFGIDDGSWLMRGYRTYHMVLGGLITFFILQLMGVVKR